MDSYQNKMLVLTNCMNLLSSSFTLMQLYLKHPLGTKKKLTREKYCFYYQRTTNSTRRKKENETIQKAWFDLAKSVLRWDKFEKSIRFYEEWKEKSCMSKE